MSRYSPHWFNTFADTIDPAQTRREAAFIADLAPPGSRSVLDVCCGRGRHAAAMRELGLEVLGMDRSAAALALARERARGCRFIEGDTLDPPQLGERFGVVCCLWQSYGFGDEAQNADLLRWMIAHAAPGGAVVLDIYTPAFFRDRLEPRAGEAGGVRFVERKRLDGRRLSVAIEYEDGSPADEFGWRLYEPGEIDAIAEGAGWGVTLACTGFNPAAPVSADAPRTQIVLRARG